MPTKKILHSVIFKIYYYEKESAPDKQEGTIYITDERGKLTERLPEEHFDTFEEIPGCMRKLLNKRGVSTP